MKTPAKPFALCIDNTDNQASLIPGKVYRILPDPVAAKDDLVRIVDESGEDYLYHKDYFLFVDFPPKRDEKDSHPTVRRLMPRRTQPINNRPRAFAAGPFAVGGRLAVPSVYIAAGPRSVGAPPTRQPA